MTREEERAYRRAYYLANRERILEKSRKWHAANKEYANARRRAYDRARSEEVKVKRAARYLRNREEILAKEREKNASNPQANRARVKRWREEVSPEKWADYCARKHAKTVERRAENPEKYLRERARRTLVLTTGIPAADLSPEIIEAKAAQLAVFRAIDATGLCRRGHEKTGSGECRTCVSIRNKRRYAKEDA